jgi:hypothetical protein
MIALYATIWVALVLFAAGESRRSLAPPGTSPPRWAWWAFTTGLALAIVHTLIAFGVVHHWVHAEAERSTAMQTEAVFGVAAGWGVYVNYLFFAVWLADAWWWRAAPAYARSRAVTWSLRAFYAIIIFNAAVVFAGGVRRIMGVLIMSWLARIWSAPAGLSPAPSSPPR